MTSQQPPEEESPSQAAQLVRALLERNGIPKHRHASFVGEFFNLSRAAAHQRVTKSSAWTVDELQALANRFGEPLAQVLGAISPADSGAKAVLRVGALQIGCRIWFARDNDEHCAESLVAMESAGSYVVVPTAAAAGHESLRIARLEIGEGTATVPRVAVFDDERDVANAVCAMLRAAGVDAVAYYAAEDLLADIPQEMFDGYVIDWLLPDNATAVPLLAAVRSLPRHSALVLLSGKTRSGSADPVEVGAAVGNFKVQLVEKPVQPPVLLSALANDGLGATEHAASPRA
jgi:CheY-like chemotaxis protein